MGQLLEKMRKIKLGLKHLAWCSGTGFFLPQIPIPYFPVRSQLFLPEISHLFVLPKELSFPRAMLAGNVFPSFN